MDADLDIKIDKSLSLTEFDLLLQKLSLDIWNRCCPVIQEKFKSSDSEQQFRPLYDDDKLLGQDDFAQAKLSYVLLKHETSIGLSSPVMRIKDYLNYAENTVTVRCEFETLYSYFCQQVEREHDLVDNPPHHHHKTANNTNISRAFSE